MNIYSVMYAFVTFYMFIQKKANNCLTMSRIVGIVFYVVSAMKHIANEIKRQTETNKYSKNIYKKCLTVFVENDILIKLFQHSRPLKTEQSFDKPNV